MCSSPKTQKASVRNKPYVQSFSTDIYAKMAKVSSVGSTKKQRKRVDG